MAALAIRFSSVRHPSAAAISLGAVCAASIVGVALAVGVQYGLAALLGMICLAVALRDLQLALVLWLPLVFLEGLPAFNLAAKAGGLLIVGVWLAGLGQRREYVGTVLRTQAKLWLALGLLLLWSSMSLLWAEDRGMVLADLWRWYAVALLMLVVATTVSDSRVLRLIVIAFVVGAVLTVSQGILTGGLTTSATAIETASEGRLEGGQGDPNFLAAGLVPAMILALAAFTGLRGSPWRWWLLGALAILALGLAASESRGGALAALAATIAAVIVFKNRRAETLAVLAVAVGVGAAWFSVSPSAWERVTDFDSGGSGRSELWEVAGRMVEANPVHGVALNNYPVVSADYVNQPGSLDRLDLIVDRTQVVHNAYLQLLAETGLIGLALFLTVALVSLRGAWRAADRFHLRGDELSETLARGVVVAMVALMAASVFISNGVDKRLWVLFGLGVALSVVASRSQGSPTTRRPAAETQSHSGLRPDAGLDVDSNPLEEGAAAPTAAVSLHAGRPRRGESGAAARVPTVIDLTDDPGAAPGPAVQHFLEFAAGEMRRLQSEAENVRVRLAMSVPGAKAEDPADAVPGLAESLVAKTAEIAEECARLSAIADRVAASMVRDTDAEDSR